MIVRIVVKGSPAPQGSKSFKGIHGGKAVLAESSKKVKPWRQDIKAACEAVMAGRPPLDGPLIVEMTFTLPKPTSAPKMRRTYPCRMPDLSKLIRSTEDAMTDAGVWVDDARVVGMSATKVYPVEGQDALDSPGVVIVVEEVIDTERMGVRVQPKQAALA